MRVNPVSILRLLYLLVITSIPILLFFSIVEFGQIHVAGMDYGVLTNATYQYYLGYKPYVDIITGTPPAYVIGGKLAFLLFGVHLNSFNIMTAVFSIIGYCYLFAIIRRLYSSQGKSIFLTLPAVVIPMLTYQTWNYDRITIFTAILFLWTSVYLLTYKEEKISWIFLGIQLVLLSWMKANTAGFLLVFSFPILLQIKQRKKVFITYVLSALCSIILLKLLSIDIRDMLQNYAWHGGRAFSRYSWEIFMFHGWDVMQAVYLYLASNIAFIVALLLVAYSYVTRKKKVIQYQIVQVTFLAIGAGILGLGTNNDLNFVDSLLIWYGIIFFLFAYRDILKKMRALIPLETIIFSTSIILVVYGYVVGFTRVDIAEAGPGSYFYDIAAYPPRKCYGLPNDFCNNLVVFLSARIIHYPIQAIGQLETVGKLPQPFFDHMFVGPRLISIQDEVDQVVKFLLAKGIAKNSICFGPRIDFNYATYEINPPKGLPLWWEAFNDPSNDILMRKMVDRFNANNRSVCIFIKNQYVFYPDYFYRNIWENYNGIGWGEIDILFRRDDPLAQAVMPQFVTALTPRYSGTQ